MKGGKEGRKGGGEERELVSERRGKEGSKEI